MERERERKNGPHKEAAEVPYFTLFYKYPYLFKLLSVVDLRLMNLPCLNWANFGLAQLGTVRAANYGRLFTEFHSTMWKHGYSIVCHYIGLNLLKHGQSFRSMKS